MVRVSLTDANQTATYYQEEQDLISSTNGVIAFNVGNGTPLQGAMSDVDWLAEVPYVQISYNLLDGKGWHDIPGQKFHSVPFSLNSRFVVCQDGPDGIPGEIGLQGPQGPAGAQGPSPAKGAQGHAGPQGVAMIIRQSSAPDNPAEGRVYLDDGTNTDDGNPGFRYYTGTTWIDL